MSKAFRTGPVAVAIGLVILAVVGVLTLGIPLPFWLDAARLDVLVIAVFGGPAALIAGRDAIRIIASAVFLSLAVVVQFGFALILWSQGPDCGSPAGDLTFALVFFPAVLRSFAIPVAVTLVASPVFVYGVLARTFALARTLVVAALLLAVGGGVILFAVLHTPPGPAVHRCADF